MIAGSFLNIYIQHFFRKRIIKENNKRYWEKNFDGLILGMLNGTLWALTFIFCGWSADSILSCLAVFVLLAVSVIDWQIFEIPMNLSLFLAMIGSLRLALDWTRCKDAVLGGAAAGFLMLFYWLTKGKGIGGGDIKLMAAAGLYLGFGSGIAAFLFGCVYACIIHAIRMRFLNAGRIFALGPYLAAGIVTAIWFGADIVEWYKMRFLIL